jgi:histidinol dehydrogenase
MTDDDGSELGQRITPLDRVGIYVPGGKAAYPSSVLMNALPAHVAGVREIVMAVPTPAACAIRSCSPRRTSRCAAACSRSAVRRRSRHSRTDATVPAVDKICGPAMPTSPRAKRRVFGVVGIDMVAGVSEIVVVADAPRIATGIALDLFSQAEHDEMAQAILITPDEALIERVRRARSALLGEMPRAGIIAAALAAAAR